MSGRKETVLDLAKFVDKGVQVKLTGGRQEWPTEVEPDDMEVLIGLQQLEELIQPFRDMNGSSSPRQSHQVAGLILNFIPLLYDTNLFCSKLKIGSLTTQESLSMKWQRSRSVSPRKRITPLNRQEQQSNSYARSSSSSLKPSPEPLAVTTNTLTNCRKYTSRPVN
ncbi:hypothetical protein CsSME_00011780 [Camellia sinensis var. sinensis]